MSDVIRAFQNPSAAYRGKPLWAWNGPLEKEELLRQIGVFSDMGMGGYFMHSRVGLDTPYLGREWFDLIKACAGEGEKRGLESWLYDEDRWPSGSAGGLVTADPEFRMRYLRCEVGGKSPAGGETVAAFAVVAKDLELREYRRLSDERDLLRAGEKLLVFRVELVQPHGFFNGGTYLDTLNPRAVQRFLQITHERYRVACGGMFGKAIPGIFSDEPHRGFVMTETPSGWTYPPDSGWVTPWTAAFPGFFKKRFGYDLRDRLPELFFRWMGKRIAQVKWHYMEALHALFLRSWAEPCLKWCAENGLRLTGHMLGEESPGAQTITCGSAMRYYEHLDTPGMDLLGRNNRAFWIARQVASVARQFGRKWTMSELYGCTGWQTTFADHKEIGDWQAFHGINLRCHHLSWYRMAGESKRDFPASIFFQSAWYREYRAVEDYYARLHLLLQQGREVCDLLVLHPVESQWAQIHAGWGGWIKSLSAASVRLDRTFEMTFWWITGAQIGFDYGDEEQLGRKGRVEKSPDGPRLRLGRGSYRAVLVCGLETMRETSLKLLEKFHAAGGNVIFAGRPPSHLDAVESLRPRELSRQAVSVPFIRGDFVRALTRAVPPRVRLENIDDLPLTQPVLLQTRRQGDTWTIAVCNTDPSRSFAGVRATFCGDGAQVQEWDCRTGGSGSIAHIESRKGLRWTFSLPPLGEKIFRVVPSSDLTLPIRKPARHGSLRSIKGPFEYHLDEPNALVFDRYAWRVESQRWLPAEDILSIDRKLRQRCGLPQRSLGMVQPWARPPRQPGKGVPITLRARFSAGEIFPITLLMEQPGRWAVELNGVSISTTNPEGWFVDPSFRKIPIPDGVLRAGENVLTLRADFDEDLDLEAVYLLGSFGIFLAADGHPRIDRLPSRLRIGDVCPQGLPFYSGRIRYEFPLGGKAVRFVRLPSFGGAVASINTEHILAFPPHEIALPRRTASLSCDVVLTRRNLLGPLHWKRGNKNFVAPDSFRSVGDAYSPSPLLEPAGLLKAPQVA